MTAHHHIPQKGVIKIEVISKFSSMFQDPYLLETPPLNGSLINKAQGKKIGLYQFSIMLEFKVIAIGTFSTHYCYRGLHSSR